MCYEFEVYDVIGPEKLKKLQKECKTTRLYIPQTMHAEHSIARIIGLEAAILLSAEFPRCLFTISQSQVVRERNSMIIKEREAGSPPQFVATRFGLTARSVRKITQGLKIQRSRPRFGLRGRNLRKVLQHGGYNNGTAINAHG
jgi:hypothetical protein